VNILRTRLISDTWHSFTIPIFILKSDISALRPTFLWIFYTCHTWW